MRRFLFVLLLLPVLLFLLAGCWSRRELNDIAIVAAVGIDKKGENYIASIQIINPSEVASNKRSGGGLGSPVATYTGKADTVFGALRQLTTKTPRTTYFAHLRMLVISEEIAREGIANVLDFFSRNSEARSDFYIVVSGDVSAERILRTYTVPMEIIPANKIFKSLEQAEEVLSGISDVTLDKLVTNIKSDGIQPILTGIILSGKDTAKELETQRNVESMKPVASISFRGMAVFKEDKMVGWLTLKQSKGFDYIVGKVKRTVSSIACPDGGKLALETIRTDSKIKGNVVNGRPRIHIQVNTEENVADVECKIDLMKESVLSELQEEEERNIRELMESVIEQAQEKYKSDIFGFGEAIHRSNPKQWRQLKEHWDEEFPAVKVDIEVNAKIRRFGTTTKPLKE